MAKIKKVPRSGDQKGNILSYQYHFLCPGCECEHAFDDRWKFNQDFEKPTISPSFLQRGSLGSDRKGVHNYGTCHSFIKDGKIQFLNDCTHKLAGQTIEMEDVE